MRFTSLQMQNLSSREVRHLAKAMELVVGLKTDLFSL